MYYEERWIDGKFCWRTSPNGAWTAYTANELAHRYQAELQRAHDLQRALDAEREKVKAEQEQWEIQAREGGRLKAQLATLQAQLRQVERERVLQCKREIQHYGDHPCCLGACEADKVLEQFARDVVERCCGIGNQVATDFYMNHQPIEENGADEVVAAIRREALGE